MVAIGIAIGGALDIAIDSTPDRDCDPDSDTDSEKPTEDSRADNYSIPSSCWIFSREMPFVSGITKITQSSCPTQQTA